MLFRGFKTNAEYPLIPLSPHSIHQLRILSFLLRDQISPQVQPTTRNLLQWPRNSSKNFFRSKTSCKSTSLMQSAWSVSNRTGNSTDQLVPSRYRYDCNVVILSDPFVLQHGFEITTAVLLAGQPFSLRNRGHISNTGSWMISPPQMTRGRELALTGRPAILREGSTLITAILHISATSSVMR